MKSETNPKTVMLKDYIIDMDSVSAKVTIDYEVVLAVSYTHLACTSFGGNGTGRRIFATAEADH